MKTSFVVAAAVAAFGFVGAARSADMPTKAPIYKAPVVVQAYNWNGFYVGANAGFSWGGATADTTLGFGGPGAFASPPCALGCSFSQSVSPSSFAGGAQLGYNYQTGLWVWGLETDFQWRDANKSDTLVLNTAPDNQVITDRQSWFGTLRGRIGTTAVSPVWLFYVTGGIAYGRIEHTVTQNLALSTTTFLPRTLSNSDIRTGWTVGGGTEYKLAQHWSIGVEYLFMQFVSDTLNASEAVIGGHIFPATTTEFKDRSQIIRAKLNYAF